MNSPLEFFQSFQELPVWVQVGLWVAILLSVASVAFWRYREARWVFFFLATQAIFLPVIWAVEGATRRLAWPPLAAVPNMLLLLIIQWRGLPMNPYKLWLTLILVVYGVLWVWGISEMTVTSDWWQDLWRQTY